MVVRRLVSQEVVKSMEGTLVLLPDRELVRRVNVKKVREDEVPMPPAREFVRWCVGITPYFKSRAEQCVDRSRRSSVRMVSLSAVRRPGERGQFGDGGVTRGTA